MSEYQYYEFLAVDRPLTDDEMSELRSRSTRADITPTRFTNFYTFGDFKGKPSAWMERYFDAFVYVANWGTRDLMFRLPRRLLDPATAGRYCRCHNAGAKATDEHVVLAFHSDDESGDDWADDGTGWMTSLLPVRAEIASGDHRALFLAWLLCVQEEELDEDESEPPVPAGLGTLTGPQQSFVDFLRIDWDLLAVAAERSVPVADETFSEELERWIADLSRTEKDRLLSRLVRGDAPLLRMELVARFRQARSTGAGEVGPRTVGELIEAAETRREARRREEEETAARVWARRERERAAARDRYLDDLAGREVESWRRVDELIATRKPAAYDEAVSLLRDLGDLAGREGRTTEAEQRIQALREQHARKPSLIQRLGRIGR